MYGKNFQYRIDNTNLLSIEKLEKLPTPRLLTYFKKYRGMRYSGICSCCGERYPTDEDESRYYDDCGTYIEQIQQLLCKREHVVK